jgi:2-C-methyl-D-erythritol 4-phosphate cytidylyltransferase
MNLYALIVAGGQGSRMQSTTPKQFLELNGKPILLHTLEVFSAFDPLINIVLVLPKAEVEQWERLKLKYDIKINHALVIGGETRFESVKNGLSKINSKGLVAIHDGVRPLVNQKIIKDCFEVAGKHGSAVTTVDMKDSIRRKTKGFNEHANRSEFQIVQTPQTFDIELIQKSYQQPFNNQFTDDASVFETAGYQIHLVKGAYSNIKITTQEDLVIAGALMSQSEKA